MTRALETLDLRRGSDGVAVLALDRPTRANALTRRMFDEIVAVCADLDADPEVRAVVLTGSGGTFCAGYDIDDAGDFAGLDPPAALALQDSGVRAVRAVHDLSRPVVAAVAGPAVGGGFSLALAADMRVAAADARFQAIFIRLGLSGADMGTSWLLPRLVGRGVAAELLYTGRAVGAEEAGRLGLANRVVDAGAHLDAALELAAAVAAHSPTAVGLTKRALLANTDAPSFAAALETEARAQALLFADPRVHAAVDAARARRNA